MNNHTYTRLLATQVWLSRDRFNAFESCNCPEIFLSLCRKVYTYVAWKCHQDIQQVSYIAAVHCLHIVTAVIYWILTHLSDLPSLQVGLFILNNSMMNSITYHGPLLFMLEVCQNARTVQILKYSFHLTYVIFPSVNVPVCLL